jgi:N-dimethylarginine dimethylaminohydrolase
MTAAWTVKDGNGQLRSEFAGVSPLEVGRRIVPTHFDAFRLHVAPSYREVFDRAVAKVLAQQGWQIVKVSTRAQKRSPGGNLPLAA